MKRALIVAINYTNTPNELRGCINDAHNVHKLLADEFGFTETKLLLEEAATTRGILDGLNWLVSDTKPGDVILFHFSGHGSQVRSSIEPDGLDEIICPIDINWTDRVIKDDDLKAIFDSVPNGVNTTVILDCCHSGTGLDQAESLFEEDAVAEVAASLLVPKEEGGRFLPMPADVQEVILKESLQLREFKTSRDINRSALLIAGCLPNQTSADAFIDGQFQGAATYALRAALQCGKKTYREIVQFMNEYMEKSKLTQRPQLDGHPSLYDQHFLEPWGTAPGQPSQTPPPGTWNPPTRENAENKKGGEDSGVLIALALIAVSLGIMFLGKI